MTELPPGTEWGGRQGKQLIADDSVIAKVRRPYLSVSTADSVRGCAARMVFDRIVPRVEDPFGPAELGTEAHAIFEKLFTLPSEKRTPATVATLVSQLNRSKRGPTQDRDRWISMVSQLVSGIFLIENPPTIDVVANELKIEAVVNGVPVLGYVDRLSTKDGALTTSDYKSGKVPNLRYGDKHGDQLRIYHSVLHEIGVYRPTAAEVLYTSHNTVREVDLSPDAIKITLRDFKTSWEKLGKMIDEATFPVKPSKLCGWCPAKDICPSSSTRDSDATPKTALFDQSVDNPAAYDPPAAKKPATVAGRTSQSGARNGEVRAVKTTPAKESSMTAEIKPWEEYDGDNLNLNSYAATAAFGLTAMAFDTLKKYNQRTTGSSVYALAATFVKIINDANATLGGEESLSFQAGRHTRLRGALHSAIDATPPPFGSDTDEWSEWTTACTKRVAGIFSVALRLWSNPNVATPWSALVRTPKENS
jgi:putative RecB family exonuclease